MRAVGGTAIAMEMKRGAALGELSGDAAIVGKADYQEALRLARQVLKGQDVDNNVDNFLFDAQTGKLVGWIDFLPGR
jgi:hypothetical protein